MIDGSEKRNRQLSWLLNFRIRMFVKSAVSSLMNDFIQSCRNYAACFNLPFPQYSKV